MMRSSAGTIGLLLAAVVLAGLAAPKSLVPAYELLKTRNGVPVYFFPSSNIPLFEVHLNFEGGSDLDPPNLSGMGTFSANAIRHGIAGMNEDEISRKLDDVAGGIEINVGEEDTEISSFGLNEHSTAINALLFEELAHPTFPSGPFERLKTNHIDSIDQLPDSPGTLATHVLDSVIFNGTAKVRPGTGLRRDVVRIRREAARLYYPRLVRTDHLKAIVIGGKDHREVLEQVLRGIESLPCSACGLKIPAPRIWNFPAYQVPMGKVLLIPRTGISEAHIRMGFRGPRRNIPEYYDLRVAETILSGHFASRLNLVIREKLGLTYNIGANFNFGSTTGSFVVSTSTRNEKVGELIVQVNKLLGAFLNGEILDQDVQIAKDYLAGSFPLGFQNMYVIADSFFNGLLNGLAPTFLDEFQGGVAAVTTVSLRAALKKYFLLSQMKTIVVADQAGVGAALGKEKIGFVVRKAQDFL